jgi:UDP-3-O-[3-hydroxymyristoyl] N-acetylglucosamine deacetylase/3-hydroxyacyl-[acyl-carrier-protein] dehydratase
LSRQKTIRQAASVDGRGLFSGEPCRLRFVPASSDSGITFVCGSDPSSHEAARIPCDIANVVKRARRTSLMNGSANVETIEHVLSAVWGLGIDNLTIEASSTEMPSIDGSAKPFADALIGAGIVEQDQEASVFVINEPVSVSEDGAMLAALPGPDDRLEILYDLDYSGTPSIGRQVLAFCLGKDDYLSQISPARTFLLEGEAREFQARGIGTHLTSRDVVVMSEGGPLDNDLRFADEHVRHKVCDLIGDLALLGRRLSGRIVAYRSGHDLNQELVRRLTDTASEHQRAADLGGEPLMDVRKIMRLLPHRYPFLMIDRIVEFEGDRRISGIKNVTINEPYFQGHYPGQPIMPGVMILEALAQLSGLLLSRRLEHTGKVAMLLSMDRVKMRRPVRPGDQLMLKAEALHVRARTGHCYCQALVAGQVAAEAEIKFMLVDAEPA